VSSAPAKSSQAAIDLKERPVTTSDVRLPFSRYVLFVGLAGLGFVADLATKNYVFANYFEPNLERVRHEQMVHWWVDGILGIQTSTNPGALFGIGQGLVSVFTVISFCALFGIVVWLFCFKQAVDRWTTISMGLISGGILGNLYDRLGLGYRLEYPIAIKNNVRDFILFRLEGVPFFDPWPNFNIADSLLVSGACLLVLHAFFGTATNHR